MKDFINICKSGVIEDIKEPISNKSKKIILEGFKNACYHNNLDVVIFLLGIVPKVEPELLRWACHDGYLQLLKTLIPNVENCREVLITGFQLACNNGHLEVASYLLIDYNEILDYKYFKSLNFLQCPIREEVLSIRKSINEKNLLEKLQKINKSVVNKI